MNRSKKCFLVLTISGKKFNRMNSYNKLNLFVIVSGMIFLGTSLLSAGTIQKVLYRSPTDGKVVEVVKNEILVVFREDVAPEVKKSLHKALRATPVSDESEDVFYQKVIIPDDESLEVMVERYRRDPAVRYAEPNYIKKAYGVNDPLYTEFSTETAKQWGLARINVKDAWALSTGTGVVVAVLDTGIVLNHPDFQGQIYSTITYIGTTGATDYMGHGTHVAGIIAARSNGQYGVGVATNSKILAVKVLDDDGIGTSDSLVRGLLYVSTCSAKPKVVNLSLGSTYYSEIENTAIQTVYQKGIAIIAAKGNDSTDEPNYPSDYQNVFSVGSVTSSDVKSSFSNYGPDLDIVAPGGDGLVAGGAPGDILSTVPLTSGATAYMAGTSMAAPFVSGVAALIYSIKPNLSPRDVYRILIQSADDLGTAGFDTYYGNGRLNAAKAVQVTSTYSPLVVAKTYTYPNPIYLSKNQKALFVVPDAIDDGSTPKVRIYNIAGDTIKEETMRSWDGKDNFGDLVPTGIYFFAVETTKGKSTGKLTVIR